MAVRAAVSIALAFACPYAASRAAEPLKASIGTLTGAKTFEAMRDAAGANHWNRVLSKLTMAKDMQKGTVAVGVQIAQSCVNCRFLVRLFDRNGNYLTHFETESLYQMFGPQIGQHTGLKRMEFKVNMRDLRDAELAEFGFAPMVSR
jgi:hypothetical protein